MIRIENEATEDFPAIVAVGSTEQIAMSVYTVLYNSVLIRPAHWRASEFSAPCWPRFDRLLSNVNASGLANETVIADKWEDFQELRSYMKATHNIETIKY